MNFTFTLHKSTNLFHFTKLIDRRLEFLHTSLGKVQVSRVLWRKISKDYLFMNEFEVKTDSQNQ